MSPAWERLFHHLFVLVFTTVTMAVLSIGMGEIIDSWFAHADQTSTFAIVTVLAIGAPLIALAVYRERRLSRQERPWF